jgi:hypothetical protein
VCLSTVEECTIKKSAIEEYNSVAHCVLTSNGCVAEGVLDREVEPHDEEVKIIYIAAFPEARLMIQWR